MTELFCNDGRCERVRRGEIHPVHDLSQLEEETKNSLQKLIQVGSELTGGSIGAAIGFLLSGPGGSVAGSVIGTSIGHALKNIGEEVSRRFMSPRETIRIGAVIIFASNNIERNIQDGHEIRKDEFFSRQLNERSSAEEIVEGVLIAAQREYEERKLLYYGNLLANIAFSPGISRAHANLLIKFSQNLSYRQLCLLALFGEVDKFSIRQANYRSEPIMSVSRVALLQEVFELDTMGLISSGSVVFGHTDIIPGRMHLEGQGEMLYKLMQVNELAELLC